MGIEFSFLFHEPNLKDNFHVYFNSIAYYMLTIIFVNLINKQVFASITIQLVCQILVWCSLPCIIMCLVYSIAMLN